MSAGLEFWKASRGWKAAHLNSFDQKSVKFEGLRMLRYVVISDCKMKFLQVVIEKLSVVLKNFYYRASNSRNFLSYPKCTCHAIALTSKPKKISNLFVLANFEIQTSDLDTRP